MIDSTRLTDWADRGLRSIRGPRRRAYRAADLFSSPRASGGRSISSGWSTPASSSSSRCSAIRGPYWLTFAGAYACFLAIYLLLIAVRPGTKRAVLLLALAVLGAAYYPFNSGAGGMLIYVAAFAPFMTESLLLAGTLIGAAALITATEGVLLHLTPWSWAVMSFLSASIGVGNLFGAMRVRANERLNLAQEQIEHLATIAERERIARDMHDVLGHTLSVVVLKSELAGKLVGNDVERARQEIVEVEQIARQALTEVREAIRGYRADGIAAEIARARRTLQAAGVRLECAAEGVRSRLRSNPCSRWCFARR